MVKTNNGNKISIITDPYKKSIGLILPRSSADVVTISHDHDDHNNIKGISNEPFCIEGPGEYDIKGIFIKGIYSYHDESKGQERGVNTIYVFSAEDLKICHLGDIGQNELTSEQLDKIGNIDILIIPVGGVYTINGKKQLRLLIK